MTIIGDLSYSAFQSDSFRTGFAFRFPRRVLDCGIVAAGVECAWHIQRCSDYLCTTSCLDHANTARVAERYADEEFEWYLIALYYRINYE